jgi:putative NADPH-quinone reductase
MRVLGIIGSPRKGGNTDVLVSQVLKGVVSKGGMQEKVYLDDFDIKPCKACLSCQDAGKCIIDDEFDMILEKIIAAETIVVGSPIYAGTVTAQMKALIDRVDSSQVIKTRGSDGKMKFVQRIRSHKPSVIICTADMSPKRVLSQAAEVMAIFLKDAGARVIAEILENHLSETGDVLKQQALLDRAFRIGASLMSH